MQRDIARPNTYPMTPKPAADRGIVNTIHTESSRKDAHFAKIAVRMATHRNIPEVHSSKNSQRME